MNLPREILKWIHGLDLSYSITNPARDLDNGFLLAEILTRYYPSKIQMFSLENSHNYDFRKNNWSIIESFLKKQELELKEVDYERLVQGDRSKLREFVVQVFEILTKKKQLFINLGSSPLLCKAISNPEISRFKKPKITPSF